MKDCPFPEVENCFVKALVPIHQATPEQRRYDSWTVPQAAALRIYEPYRTNGAALKWRDNP